MVSLYTAVRWSVPDLQGAAAQLGNFASTLVSYANDIEIGSMTRWDGAAATSVISESQTTFVQVVQLAARLAAASNAVSAAASEIADAQTELKAAIAVVDNLSYDGFSLWGDGVTTNPLAPIKEFDSPAEIARYEESVAQADKASMQAKAALARIEKADSQLQQALLQAFGSGDVDLDIGENAMNIASRVWGLTLQMGDPLRVYGRYVESMATGSVGEVVINWGKLAAGGAMEAKEHPMDALKNIASIPWTTARTGAETLASFVVSPRETVSSMIDWETFHKDKATFFGNLIGETGTRLALFAASSGTTKSLVRPGKNGEGDEIVDVKGDPVPSDIGDGTPISHYFAVAGSSAVMRSVASVGGEIQEGTKEVAAATEEAMRRKVEGVKDKVVDTKDKIEDAGSAIADASGAASSFVKKTVFGK